MLVDFSALNFILISSCKWNIQVFDSILWQTFFLALGSPSISLLSSTCIIKTPYDSQWISIILYLYVAEWLPWLLVAQLTQRCYLTEELPHAHFGTTDLLTPLCWFWFRGWKRIIFLHIINLFGNSSADRKYMFVIWTYHLPFQLIPFDLLWEIFICRNN